MDENGKFFREKGKFVKFSRKSQNFSKIGGNLKQGGKCIMASGGMDAPAFSRYLVNSSLHDQLKAYSNLVLAADKGYVTILKLLDF